MGHVSLETWIQLLIWVAVLIGLVIVALVVVQRFRGSAAGKGANSAELLTNFQEMRERGDISDADYRKIKSVLGDKIQDERSGERPTT
ncbi:MAG TPA: hypothetical protein VFV87_00870 [Pirellulaceae bacterium]|nr:hypothetical protein [Pirellulaceae bacterium]